MIKEIIKSLRGCLGRTRIGDMLKWQVTFDATKITITGKNAPPEICWNNIRRIAYVTSDGGPFADYYIALQRNDTGQWHYLEVSISGMDSLAKHIDRMPGTTFGSKGKLANSGRNDSVIIWPASDAGKTIDVTANSQ